MAYPKKIFTKIRRDLFQLKVRAALVIIITAVSVSIYIGTHTALRSIKNTSAKLIKSLQLADLEINILPITSDDLPEIPQGIEGIRGFEKRLILPGSIEAKNDELIASLLIFVDDTKTQEVNKFMIIEGRAPEPAKTTEVLLDYSVARDRGYHVGDKITIGIQGFFSDFEIVGLAVSPEFLISSANPDFYLPIKGSLAIVYTSMDVIKNLFGYSIYNNISVLFDKDADPYIVEKKLRFLLLNKGIEIDKEVFQEDIYSVKVIKRDMQTFFIVLPMIVTIFYAVSFLILFFSVTRMLQADMPQIGTLISLGFSRYQIAYTYITVVSILGFIGYFFGCAGSFFMAKKITASYINGTGFPFVFYYYSKLTFLKALLYSLSLPILAVGLPMSKIFKTNIPEMLTGIEKQNLNLAAFLKKIKALWNGLFEVSLALNIAIRNIWRRKIFFALSVFCIVFAISFSMATLITNTSIDQTVNDFLNLGKWTIFVQFNGQVSSEEIAKLREIKEILRIESYPKGFVTIGVKDKIKLYQIMGISTENRLMKIDLIEGDFFSSDRAQEIILNTDICRELGLRIGDSVKVYAKERPGKEKESVLKVVGVMNNLIIGQGFVPLVTAQNILYNKGGFSGALLSINGPFEAIKNKLYHTDIVGYVVHKDSVKKTLNMNMKNLSVFLYFYCALSLIVSVLIVFISLYLNVIDRKTEYAVLLANGFTGYEIGRMILYEVLIMMILIVITTIPLSVLFSKLICWRIAQTANSVHLHLEAMDFLKILIPAAILMFGTALYCIKIIMNLNIAATIKNRAFG